MVEEATGNESTEENAGSTNESTAPKLPETSTDDKGIKPKVKSTKPESLKAPRIRKPPKKNTDYLEYPYQLEAPKNEKGTNWREYFYNEVTPVVGRIAYVRRPSNARDLIRRGWALIEGEIEGIENQERTIVPDEKGKGKDNKKGEKDKGDGGEGKDSEKKSLAQKIKDKLTGDSKDSKGEKKTEEGPAEAPAGEGEGKKPAVDDKDDKPNEEDGKED